MLMWHLTPKASPWRGEVARKSQSMERGGSTQKFLHLSINWWQSSAFSEKNQSSADDAIHSPVTGAIRPGGEEKQHQVGHWHVLPNRLLEALSQTFRFNFMRLFVFTISAYLRRKKNGISKRTLTFNNWLIKVFAGFNLLNKGNGLGMRSKEG